MTSGNRRRVSRRSRCGRRSRRCRRPTGRVAVRGARLLRWGADSGHGDHGLRRARSDAGDRGVPQRGAGRIAGGDAPRAAVGRDHLAADRRVHRAAGELGVAVPDAEHRDDVRHDLARPARLGADGDRGAARVVVRGRRLLVSLRRRHGHRRPRPGQGRKVPLPAPWLRRRGPGGLLHLPLPDVHQLGRAAGARRCPGDEADQDLPARRGRQPGRERVRQHRRPGVQHRPRQRLLVLRGGRRARAGGARRGARRRTGRPARGDRHRQGPAVRTG